ncbi:MAG: type II toxin-antitoxin system RelE/ParE family toxin [Oscillospiraceae bacterium]|nr:type II toxin-antitoxin system RelE/ParE family toxin [Oscillospiraceae bacterium]
MDEYRVELAITAKQDLREIHSYVENNLKEPVIADKLLDKIESKIASLSNMPQKCAVLREEQLRHRNIRKLIVGNYLVFYVINEKAKTVYVARVLYGRRDWINLL